MTLVAMGMGTVYEKVRDSRPCFERRFVSTVSTDNRLLVVKYVCFTACFNQI